LLVAILKSFQLSRHKETNFHEQNDDIKHNEKDPQSDNTIYEVRIRTNEN